MRRVLPLLVLLAACGRDSGEASLPLALEIRGIAPESIARVQIAVLANGSAFLCGDVQKACLRSKVANSDLVPLLGDDGKEHPAIRFAVNTEALLSPKGQTFTLSVKEGTNYMVVAEILSVEAKVLATGCSVLAEAAGDDNPPLVIQALAPATPPECKDGASIDG